MATTNFLLDQNRLTGEGQGGEAICVTETFLVQLSRMRRLIRRIIESAKHHAQAKGKI